jgi:hypothetical protein
VEVVGTSFTFSRLSPHFGFYNYNLCTSTSLKYFESQQGNPLTGQSGLRIRSSPWATKTERRWQVSLRERRRKKACKDIQERRKKILDGTARKVKARKRSARRVQQTLRLVRSPNSKGKGTGKPRAKGKAKTKAMAKTNG